MLPELKERQYKYIFPLPESSTFAYMQPLSKFQIWQEIGKLPTERPVTQSSAQIWLLFLAR